MCLITYSDGATVLLDWTPCTVQGKATAMAAINAMKPERSTNLMAGVTCAYDAFGRLPVDGPQLQEYALNLILTTDGMPSAQWNPARGREGYAPLVRVLGKRAIDARGGAGRISMTSIGLGCKLDSELLAGMSDQFLHMPDPGSVGPFMVNLLAALRCTARLPSPDGGLAASYATLVMSPAKALTGPLLGWGDSETRGDQARVGLGWISYDQPRHIVLKLTPGAPAFSVGLEVAGVSVASTESSAMTPATEPELIRIEAQKLRLEVADALLQILRDSPAGVPAPSSTPLHMILARAERSVAKAEPDVVALRATLEAEALLGAQVANYARWGAHYYRTLRLMLLWERRSNFRDQALQHFGRDAQGRDALFEEVSNDAEMRFATLKAPEPSLLMPEIGSTALGVPVAVGADAGAPPPARVLPAEFMRGGGCFAPEATVLCPGADGAPPTRVRIDALRAGDVVLTPAGRAAVRCVVVWRCAGGMATLSRLQGGVELTEWHPVFDPATLRWRFPLMCGTRVLRRCEAVYNLLLDCGHVIDVGGVAAVTLAHGLQGPVVGHDFWGGEAVVRRLRDADGWEQGRVVLQPGWECHTREPPEAWELGRAPAVPA